MFLVAGRCHRSGRQPKTYVRPKAAITVFELRMMGGVSSETCWAIKKHWNNKFYYTVASCWFFLWDLYYDARIHEHQTWRTNWWAQHYYGFSIDVSRHNNIKPIVPHKLTPHTIMSPFKITFGEGEYALLLLELLVPCPFTLHDFQKHDTNVATMW